MHKMDKSEELRTTSDFGVAHEHDHEPANSKKNQGSSSFFNRRNEADRRGSTNIMEGQGALPTTYWARELEVDREGWNSYLKGNLAEHGRFMGISCLYWSFLCCLRFGGTQQVDVEHAGKKKQQKVRKGIFHMSTLAPSDKICIAWVGLMGSIDLWYTAFLMPILIVFPTNNTNYTWGAVVNLVFGGLFYWVDILMRFRMGFCVVYNLKRELVMDGGLIAHFYVRHNTFATDFIAAVPAIAELVWVCLSGTQYGLALHIILLLRLARMRRVFTLMKGMLTLALTGQYSRKLFRGFSVGHVFILMLTYVVLWLLNLLGCSWIWLAGIEGKDNSWTQSIGNETDISEKTPARQWIAAVYFSVMLVTTTGLGDIKPCTPTEEVLASFQMLLGVFLFGLIVSTSQNILGMLSDNARQMGPLREKLQWVEVWLNRRHLSDQLGRRVRAYYTEIWAHNKDLHHDSFYGELPAAIRTDIAMEITQHVFDGSCFLSVLHERARRSLCERLRPFSLPAGHDACEEGDDCDKLWMLTEGEMTATRREQKEEYLAAPAIVGEAAVLAACLPELQTRPSTYQAEAPCTLWTMEVKDLLIVVDLYPELTKPLQEGLHQHLKNQFRRMPGQKWSHILRRYEQVPDDKKPFSEAAARKHIEEDASVHDERRDLQDEMHGDLSGGAADSDIHKDTGPSDAPQRSPRTHHGRADDSARAWKSIGQASEPAQDRRIQEQQLRPDWQHHSGSQVQHNQP